MQDIRVGLDDKVKSLRNQLNQAQQTNQDLQQKIDDERQQAEDFYQKAKTEEQRANRLEDELAIKKKGSYRKRGNSEATLIEDIDQEMEEIVKMIDTFDALNVLKAQSSQETSNTANKKNSEELNQNAKDSQPQSSILNN